MQKRTAPLEAVHKYQQALLDYRNECSLFSRIRNQYSPFRDKTTDQELILFFKAQRRFKQACKDFRAARESFLVQLRPCSEEIASTNISSDEESIELYTDASFKGTKAMQHEAQIESQIAKNDSSIASIVEAARAYNAARTAASTSEDSEKEKGE